RVAPVHVAGLCRRGCTGARPGGDGAPARAAATGRRAPRPALPAAGVHPAGDAIPRPPLPRCCMVTRAELRPTDPASAQVWDLAARVPDPEVPVLTIEDVGVLREARVSENGVHVVLTPTYSGCPAIDQMRADVTHALRAAGYENIEVTYTLSPAWTTDWMSEEGKRK